MKVRIRQLSFFASHAVFTQSKTASKQDIRKDLVMKKTIQHSQRTYTSSFPDFSQFFTMLGETTMAAIFPPHGAKIPDEEVRCMITGSVRCWNQNMWNEMRVYRGRQLGFLVRCKKTLRLIPGRCYSQNALSGDQGSDTGFSPTRRALDRADREFESLGPKATFQGSALKLEDAPKLKLPEVMSCLMQMLWFNFTLGVIWYFPLFCILLSHNCYHASWSEQSEILNISTKV